MKKTSRIELNALLDVILLLIFVLILNMNMANSKKNEEINQVNDQYEQILQQNKIAEQKYKDLTRENKNLKELIQEQSESLKEVENMRLAYSIEKQSIDNLVKGISRFLHLDDGEMKTLLTTSENLDDKNLMEQLSKIINEKDIIKQLEKYETISKKFFYVEIEIATNNNRLYINKRATNVYITKQETTDAILLNNKKEQIKDEIEKAINDRDGGYSMILVSLGITDEEVYQYAYEVVWHSIKELENKYGTQKFFKTELSYMGGDLNGKEEK